MRIGVGGKVGGVRVGVSNRGVGAGVGPLSVGTSWKSGRRRKSSSKNDGAALLILLVIGAILLGLMWPWLLGTWIAVQCGAGNPSAARSVVGWVLEVPWLALLGLAAIGMLMQKVKPTPTGKK